MEGVEVEAGVGGGKGREVKEGKRSKGQWMVVGGVGLDGFDGLGFFWLWVEVREVEGGVGCGRFTK